MSGAASSRRELGLAVLLCLAGSGLVLFAASRGWAQVPVTGRPVLPDVVVAVRGRDLHPGLPAVALVGLAGVVALLATRRAGRVVVGVLLLLAGLGAVVLAAQVLTGGAGGAAATEPVREAGGVGFAGPPDLTGWPLAAAVGGLLLALSGAVVAVRGPRWAALSRRYETPAVRAEQEAPAPSEPNERELWEALDRGEDPTGR